jgi:hypothetical protein
MAACKDCPYAACIDICPDYDIKGLEKSGIPKGLRQSNPKEYFRLYRQLKREFLLEVQNEYNRKNREAMRIKWARQKRKERGQREFKVDG